MAQGQAGLGKKRWPPKPNALRLLALEIRPSKAGFAFFEGTDLVDWGVTTYGITVPALKRVVFLLDLHAPSIIVTRRRQRMTSGTAVPNIVASIKWEARRRTVRFHSFDARQIRAFFAERECHNKHAVGAQLAEWYPALAWRLPPKRKLWECEPHNALLFDAVATAVAFLASGR